MEKLFQKIVNAMEENGNIAKEDKEVYVYALMTVLVYLTNIALSIGIGVAMGMPGYCVIFLGAFIILRQEAGGYHASGWFQCYFLSCVILAATLVWIKIQIPYQLGVTTILTLLSTVFIIIYAPLEDKNKSLDSHERDAIKKRARKIVVSELAVGLLCMALDIRIAFAILSAIIWCGCGYLAWFGKRKWSKE